jgi:hypothetical protein
MPKKQQKNSKIKSRPVQKPSWIQQLRSFFSFRNPELPYVGLVILLATVAGWWMLTPGYFNMHDDLQMMRQLVVETCFKDGQIPCRWTQHMGYGYGFPLFNYYPQLPYLVGEIYRLLGFSFVDTAKLVFFTSFVASGLTMYYLAREFWGRLGGLFSSAFYIWAPYHSEDIYVRGAMNEAWAFIWFPLILLSSYRLIITGKYRYIPILALGFFGLLTSHNLMVLIFTPLFAGWCLLWVLKTKPQIKTFFQLLLSGLWAFGLAAFFTIPVALEQKYVHVETLVAGYYEYVAHFATLNQLLVTRFWGYGASVWGENDNMAFQVGHMHWILSLILLALVMWRYIKTRKVDTVSIITLFFIASGWFAVFMAHNKSTPIWLLVNDYMKFVQFPWRFLTLSTLSLSMVAGALITMLPVKDNKYKYAIAAVLIIILVVLNKSYFAPEHMKMGPINDQQKFSNAAWDMQQTAGIYDYLPVGAKTAPKSPQKALAEINEGKGELSNASQKSNYAHITANVISDNAVLQINIFQYPGWEVFVDGNKTETFVGSDEWGRMHINLNKGHHDIEARFVNTPVRSASNSISLISWLGLITIPLWRKKFAKVLG